jgi:phosphoribosylaminoimidazolecarboxamide formyltransferase/IMP cyclohydrolase
MKVRRAIVSVHDKTGVVDLGRRLAALGVEVLSTGGTASLLRREGVAVREVADVTGFPEMMDGRVKTLHPKIHGGILARRDVPAHLAALEQHDIPPIDLVVVALYPFEATIAKTGVTHAEAVEQIDIGGPAMIRAAAKNHDAVAVVTDPSQYAKVLGELERSGGVLSRETCARLAGEAFRRTSSYDAAITSYLGGGLRPPSDGPSEPAARSRPASPQQPDGAGEAGARSDEYPARLSFEGEKALSLKYGENPHQTAAFYRLSGAPAVGLAAMKALHGPELGYNNLLDFSAALALLLEFDEPAAVVIKHTNPCGAALGATVREAMVKAKASDPVSIYGGIVGVNRTLDMAVVEALAGIFVEILFAPSFAPDALDELERTKKRCRVFEVPCDRRALPRRMQEYRSVLGGLLVQSTDLDDVDESALKTVSRRPATAQELRALRFAWRVGKHAKSNAIVLTSADQVIGVGAGQMNRVDAARLAVMRARATGLETRGTVCASDAFFPFRDGLDVVAEAGATAVMHPGGSLRDDEIIAAADEHGMAMVLTGIRHFRH